MDKAGFNLEVWVRMYEEQIRHVRHHESLRSASTNIAVVVSAAVLGLFAAGVTSEQQWVLWSFLMLLNIYGLVMSLKHYERSRLHHAVSTKYRDVISEVSKFDDYAINAVRHDAHREHKTWSLPIQRVRAYWMWCGLHVLLVFLGAGLLLAGA
ncbi:MAG: hypothetical protein OXN86_08295 [Chloroflexota bacterium]|nr:hypothetical protein [Chloroflexota bacterium]